MKENLKKFLEEASKNEELKAKLAAITDKDTAAAKAIELANEYGITLTAEDLKLDKDDKLSLNELENAAGGGVTLEKAKEITDGMGEYLDKLKEPLAQLIKLLTGD